MNTKPNNSKERIIILILSILIIIALAIIGFIAIYNSKEARLKRQLSLGDKYLGELEYEDALLEYQIAVAIDPKSADAYIGAANAYIGLKAYDLANEVLERGIQNAGSMDELLKMQEQVREQIALLEEALHADAISAQEEENGESDIPSIEEEQDEEETEETETEEGDQFADDYRELYANFLRENKTSERGFPNHFELINIDDDNIPELAMTDGSDHPTGVHIYKIINGEIVELGEYGWFGTIEYIDHGNMIHVDTYYFGDYYDAYFSINDKEMECKASLEHIEPDAEFGVEETYNIDEQNVSKQAYDKLKNEMSGNYEGCRYDDINGTRTMHDITEDTIERYVKQF